MTPTVHDTTAQTVARLDEAIAALDSQSADWKLVLQNTINKLTDSTQSTIRNELSDTLNRGVAAVGAQTLCTVDFLRARVRQEVYNIRAQLLKLPVPAKTPAFCQAVPATIDPSLIPANRLTHLELWGYDFDTTPRIQVLLETSDHVMHDITSSLVSPTHYLLTLNLGGNGAGPQVSAPNAHVVHLVWKGSAMGEVVVTQPNTPLCVRTRVLVSPGKFTLATQHTAGDSNFGQSQIRVRFDTYLTWSYLNVGVIADMSAVEMGGDRTAADGSQYVRLFTPPSGQKVEWVEIPTGRYSLDYVHDPSQGDVDLRTGGGGTVVEQVTFQGFKGPNAADGSVRADIVWAPFYVTMSGPPAGATNCVTQTALSQTVTRSLISSTAIQRLLATP